MESKRKQTFEIAFEVAESIFREFVNKYSVIFKAGVMLLGLALFALSTHTPQILDYELKAKELSFEIQVMTGKKILDVDCAQLKNHQKQCLLAQYQTEASKGSVEFLMLIYHLLSYTGMSLIGAGIAGFILQRVFESTGVAKKPPTETSE